MEGYVCQLASQQMKEGDGAVLGLTILDTIKITTKDRVLYVSMFPQLERGDKRLSQTVPESGFAHHSENNYTACTNEHSGKLLA